MKVSRSWLQNYFSAPLPSAHVIADALTLHVAEVEEVEADSMEVKVLPDRAAYLLCHRGIAKELSAILNISLKKDPLRKPLTVFPKTEDLSISIDHPFCLRHMGALVRGVKVAPSPEWLRAALESVGQRSINNIVDITNYLTLDMGQPMHAFDANKISKEGAVLKIEVRRTKGKEKVTILSGEELALPEGTLVIADATSGTPLDIAGIKGGLASGITEDTTDLFVSVANYDGVLIRKTTQALRLFTDASQRFQNKPSPELVAYGMQGVLKLFEDIAGGKTVGVVDVYPNPAKREPVSVTAEEISHRVGAAYADEDLISTFEKLDFSFEKKGTFFSVTAPFERTDIKIPEDLSEEVARIQGYDKVLPTELSALSGNPDQSRFRGIERMKDMLVEQGFIEVSTQSFAKKGDIFLANPLDKTKSALRNTLRDNLDEALLRANQYAPLVLGPLGKPKLFEVGSVFPNTGEYLALEMSESVPEWGDSAATSDDLSKAKLEDYGSEYEPVRHGEAAFRMYSSYPFAMRDIALWCPETTDPEVPRSVIADAAGELLMRADIFDTFKKDDKVSYAYRLLLQSSEKTLTEDDIVAVMDNVTKAVEERNWQVR